MVYRALAVETAAAYAAPWVGSHPTAREVGDGNLNLVFIVQGTTGAAVVKQALPYVRLVGESWPLALSRAHYEHAALVEQSRHAAEFLPALHHHDAEQALTVMAYLQPHITLRKGWIAGERYSAAARHLGLFLARTLAGTCDFVLPPEEKNRLVRDFSGNTAMSKISEDLLFDEPYIDAPMNRHTPQLASEVAALRADGALKCAAQQLKWRFRTSAEALLHGDLHSGSVMVTADDTRVIDPEFACVGPIGFDVGMLLANVLFAAFAREDRTFVTGEARELLQVFETEFVRILQAQRTGSVGQPRMGDVSELIASRMQEIRRDVAGFAGIELIRRVVGLAHVDDFESVVDPEVRALREAKALRCGRALMLQPEALERLETFL